MRAPERSAPGRIGAGEIGIHEIGTEEIGPRQLRAREVQLCEIELLQRFAGEIRRLLGGGAGQGVAHLLARQIGGEGGAPESDGGEEQKETAGKPYAAHVFSSQGL